MDFLQNSLLRSDFVVVQVCSHGASVVSVCERFMKWNSVTMPCSIFHLICGGACVYMLYLCQILTRSASYLLLLGILSRVYECVWNYIFPRIAKLIIFVPTMVQNLSPL